MINTIDRNERYEVLLDKVGIVHDEANRITNYLRDELVSQQKIELHILKYNQNIANLNNYQLVENQVYEMAQQLYQTIEQVFELKNYDLKNSLENRAKVMPRIEVKRSVPDFRPKKSNYVPSSIVTAPSERR